MYNRPVLRSFAVALTLLCRLAYAEADTASQMKRLVADLRYEEAIAQGDRALAAGQIVVPELRSIYELLGTSHFLLGDEARASHNFLELLALDPHAALPADVSPKLRGFVERLRVTAATVIFPIQPLKASGPDRVTIEIPRAPSSLVENVLVHVRKNRSGPYEAIPLERRDDRFAVERNASDVVQYWIEAADASGAPIAYFGTEHAPHDARVLVADSAPTAPNARATPIYRRGWFWGAVAAVLVVAGASVAVGLALANRSTNLDVCVGTTSSPCR